MPFTPPPAPSHGVHDVPEYDEITPDHPAWKRRDDESVWGTMAEHGTHNPFHDALRAPVGDWGSGTNAKRWEDATDFQKEKAHAGMRHALSGAHLALAIPTGPLMDFLDEGKMRTAFDLPEGEHWSMDKDEYLKGRTAGEYAHFRYPMRGHHPEARPVYGYLTHDPFREGSASGYGNHTLVLSRPALAHRTTWSVGDTLNEEDHIRASSLHQPGLHSLHPQFVRRHMADLGAHDMIADDNWRNSYVEAQYHGGVGTHHVRYAILRTPKDDKEGASRFVKRMAGHLAAAGIPWVHTQDWQGPERATAWNDGHTSHYSALGALVAPHDPLVRWHQGSDRYIVELAAPGRTGLRMGQVADLEWHTLYPPVPLDSILARGYWQPLGHPVEAEDILALVRPAGV